MLTIWPQRAASLDLTGFAPLIELSDDLFMRNRPACVEILDTLCDLPALPLDISIRQALLNASVQPYRKRFRPVPPL